MYKALPTTSGTIIVLGMSGHQIIAGVLLILVASLMIGQMILFKVKDKKINNAL